jgi:hypothetical protein
MADNAAGTRLSVLPKARFWTTSVWPTSHAPRTKARFLNLSHPMMRYDDADDAQEFLGQSSVSFLSASLKLFFDEMRAEIRRFNRRVPDFDTNCAKKHGFFAANQKWFTAL